MPERFVKLDVATLGRTDLTPADKLVYAAIRDRIGDHPAAWLGFRRLAADCGLSRTTAEAAVNRLAAAALLIVDRPEGNPAGKSNTYRLPSGGDEEASKPDVPENGTPGRLDCGTSQKRDVPGNGTRTYQEMGRGRTKKRTQPDSTRKDNSNVAADLLREIGVAPPVAAALAAEHSLAEVDHAIACAGALDEAGKLQKPSRAGYVVARLKAGNWDEPTELTEVQRRERERLLDGVRERTEIEQRRRDAEASHATLERARNRLAAISAERLAAVLDAAAQGMPHRPAVPATWLEKPAWVLAAELALQRMEATETPVVALAAEA